MNEHAMMLPKHKKSKLEFLDAGSLLLCQVTYFRKFQKTKIRRNVENFWSHFGIILRKYKIILRIPVYGKTDIIIKCKDIPRLAESEVA